MPSPPTPGQDAAPIDSAAPPASAWASASAPQPAAGAPLPVPPALPSAAGTGLPAPPSVAPAISRAVAQAAALAADQLPDLASPARLKMLEMIGQHRLPQTAATRALEAPLARLAALLPEAEQAAARLMTQVHRFMRATQESPPSVGRLFTAEQADAPAGRAPEDGRWVNYHQTGDVGLHDVAEVYRRGNLRERMNALGNCQARVLPHLSDVTRRAKNDPALRARLAELGVDVDFLLRHYAAAGDRPNIEIIEALPEQPTAQQKLMRRAYAAERKSSSNFEREYIQQLNRRHANPGRRTDGLMSPPLSQREIDQAAVGAKKEASLAVQALERLQLARLEDEKQMGQLPAGAGAPRAGEPRPAAGQGRPLASGLAPEGEPIVHPFELPHRDGGLLFRPNGHAWHEEAKAGGMFSKVSISGTTFRLVALSQIFDARPGGREAMRWAIIGHLVPMHHTYHEVMSALADHGFPYVATPAAMVAEARALVEKFGGVRPETKAAAKFQRERIADLERTLAEVQRYI